MAGRCTECGTYHYDGPPCDECGEMGFTDAPKIKQCGECGTVHKDENPPCNQCGAMGFQRVANPEDWVDEFEKPRNQGTTASTNTGAAPPTSTNRRTILYGAGIVAVLGGGYYVYTTRNDYPTTTAPGESNEASGIRFETAETEIRGIVNDERSAEGLSELGSTKRVSAFTEYYNKRRVNTGEVDGDAFDGKFNLSDWHAFYNEYRRRISDFERADELGKHIGENFVGDSDVQAELASSEWDTFEYDIHVNPEGEIYTAAVFA